MKMNILALITGSILGGLGRYYISAGSASLLGHGFPFGTVIVNFLGCLAIGLFDGFVQNLQLRILLITGLCGALTTFSTFALDFWLLSDRGQINLALLYIVLSVAGGILFFKLGLVLARGV